METSFASLWSLPILLLGVLIEYRLAEKTLERKYGAVFLIMLAVKCIGGWINLYFIIANDIGENALYHGLLTLLLYLILFKGSLAKKIFLTVLLACGMPMLFYLFLPFCHYLFPQSTEIFSRCLQALEWLHWILTAIWIEYIGHKFQNLRRDLPRDYTLYLSAVIIFIYVAIYSAYDRMLIRSQGVVSLPTALAMAAFAIAGIAIVTMAIFAVDRQVSLTVKHQLDRMEAENFKTRQVEWRRFCGFRHDIKNHLLCLDGLLKSAKTEEAMAYMENLSDTVKEFDNPVETGNPYADALLGIKYAEAVAAGIAVSIHMALPADGCVAPVDLCCILSNAFDNAINACGRLTHEDKWIKAEAFVRQGQLIITIKNSKPPDVTVTNGIVFPKEITAYHGLGLDNVRATVEKYGGILDLSAGEAFVFSVLLPTSTCDTKLATYSKQT